jgi:hypothetical protein
VPTPRVRRLLNIIVAALIVLDVAAVVRVRSNENDVGRWDDPKVAALARIASHDRGLRFQHTVPIAYVDDPEDFVQQVSGTEEDLSAKTRRALDKSGQEFKALVLVPSTTDLYALERRGISRTALAVYSPEHQKVFVNAKYGGRLDEDTRVTLVHELTHVLQDQRFDLTREFGNSLQQTLFHALIEGDATRVQTKYLLSFSPEEQRAYVDHQVTLGKAANADLGDYPSALKQFSSAPYTLGAALATLVAEDEGVGALNRLFEHPPASDEGLINPFKLLANERPLHVAAPKVKPGETVIERGRFGALAWFIALANYLDPRTALSAVDGWGGDAYLAYRSQNRPCMRIVFAGDTPTDANEMFEALNRWQGVFHNGRVSASRVGADVQHDACQPDALPASPATAKNAITLPFLRSTIAGALRHQGVARHDVECVAGEFTKNIDLKALTEDKPDVSGFAGLAQHAGQVCGVT